jgi:hypothetical protein
MGTVTVLHPKRTHVTDVQEALSRCGMYETIVVIERAVAGKRHWYVVKRDFATGASAAEYTDLFELPDEQAVRDLWDIPGIHFRDFQSFGKRERK